MACRDPDWAAIAARSPDPLKGTYVIVHLNLSSLHSVHARPAAFRAGGKPLDALVYNVAIYLPQLKEANCAP